MMKQEIKEFYEENKSYTIAFIVLAIVCLAGVWLVHDHTRNEPVYNNTDRTVDELEKRLDNIESRVTIMQGRLDETQKTVTGISERVERGRKNAQTVAAGIGTAETRLDEAIQRSGRIQNLIDEIERANQKGKVHP